MAIVGTLGLIGMLIKNGIVLMDEITLQLNQGVEPITALVDSAQSRLRPVTMAALTTILGMIPLLPDAMFGSLAASIMGGPHIRNADNTPVYPCTIRIILSYKKRTIMKKTTFILAALLSAACISAQETLTLEQCREMALKYNKEMAAAARQTESARYTAKSYKGNFFPNFSLSGTGIYSHTSDWAVSA